MAISEAHLIDNMEFMAKLPDGYFELAVVDPPYGIGNFIPQAGDRVGGNFKAVEWNNAPPSPEYFVELCRVSVHQIIWGANYYNCFPEKGGTIVWNKQQFNPKMSRCEIASHSFYQKVDYIEIAWNGFQQAINPTIHPCQKPVALYKWLFQKYAKPGWKIFDSHLGSGSSRIAAHDLGFDFYGCENDESYFLAQEERFRIHTAQASLFTIEPEVVEVQSGLF